MSTNPRATPLFTRLPSTHKSTAAKRDSMAAELDRDPQLSHAKRKQRTQTFTSQMNHLSLERQVTSLQAAKVELESKLLEKDAKIERLEGDRRILSEREKAERDEKERERTEREEEKRKSDSDIRALRNSFMDLREEYDELKDTHSSLSRQMSATIASQKSEISSLKRQLDILQTDLLQSKQRMEERENAFKDLQSRFDELNEAQANESSRRDDSDSTNWTIVRDELHRQADHLRSVEAENAKLTAELLNLRQRHASIEVLKEQKRELERKLSGTEGLKEQVVKLEAELIASRTEREQWVSKESDLSHTPISVTQTLSSLRLANAQLHEQNSSNLALLHAKEAELQDTHQACQKLQEESGKSNEEVTELKDRLRRAEQRVVLAEREAGFLQAMMASFKAEDAEEGGHIEEAITKHTRDLELLLAEYKQTIQECEAKIAELGENSISKVDVHAREELEADLQREKLARVTAEAALKEASSANENHLEAIDKLEQTLFELQGEIGGGRHVPPGTRILSLRDNPASQWEDLSKRAMDRLKDENEALLKRLKQLEDGGVRVATGAPQEDLIPRESFEVINREKEELEEALKQKEKRLVRLRQVFSAKTDEFKEAIASILGVKLAFYPNGQVRVTSQFDLNAAFVFQPANSLSSSQTRGGEGMTMQLVAQGEGGPEDLPQLMRYWVEQEQCIPGFLASVTLECYEKMKNQPV